MDQPLIWEFKDEHDIQDFLYRAFLKYLENKQKEGYLTIGDEIVGQNAKTGEYAPDAQRTTKLAEYHISPDNTFYCTPLSVEQNPGFGTYTEKPMPDTWQNAIID